MQTHGADAFAIVAFPCVQFLYQESSSNAKVKAFAERRGFKGKGRVLMDRVKGNGWGTSPVWDYLKTGTKTGTIMWNFTKFLCDVDGRVVARFGPDVHPTALSARIGALVAAAKAAEVRSIHWSPYDRVGVVNAVP